MKTTRLMAGVALAVSLAVPVTAQAPNSENTLRLEEGGKGPAAAITDLAWLGGYWRGEGLGGTVEEVWTLPAGDRMQGIFTLARQGKPAFSEAMQLVEQDGTLLLKVKHFTPDFVAWEEKEKFVRFPLVRLAENEAYFNGLTFRRRGDELLIYLVLSREGEKTEHELRLERVPF